MLNEAEYKVLNYYLKKYKIENKSRLYRELLIGQILKQLNEDTPMLFEPREMRGI